MVKRYAEPGRSAAGADAMALDEVISYLSRTDDSALAPLESIMAQTEAIGDPALPTIEQTAILRWVGAAFDHWQQAFPLDPALAARLQLVKPVAAALALVEPDFLIPGEHPLHRILDSLQLGAVGWQTTLGRAGQALEKQVTATVETVLTWFDDDALDLETTCNELIASTRRDMARADRMTQRLIETEQGRSKTQEAKRHAADMINKALREYPAPPAIGEFLKGHWHESAQLILLKFGRESVEWQQMSAATDELLDSMQPTEADDTKRRQYLFETVTRLPKELKRWLISLQHDRAALDEVVGLVEYAHLGILRNQPLQLEQTEPIAADDFDYGGSPERASPGALDSLQEGQWYLVRPGRADATRARLILRMDQAGRLLFASLAGVKVIGQEFDEFARLVDAGEVVSLDSGASFSRALAAAAGVGTVAELAAIPGAVAELKRRAAARERKSLKTGQARQGSPEGTPRAEAGVPDDRPAGEAQTPAAQPPESAPQLPMGVWLGFHDGDTPLLARLAVHDRERDSYTFVNRNGIRMRELNTRELLALMDSGLIDVLESKSSFREEVSRRAREQE